jgi:CRP-like cAMP-binding protein
LKDYMNILENSSIFYGASSEEISSMLGCMGAYTKQYGKGSYIYTPGDKVSHVVLVLEGEISIIGDDYWGNRNIISRLAPGRLFGEVFACLENTPITLSVMADTDCTIMFLEISKIVTTCSNSCTHHTMIIRNLLKSIAMSNLNLTEKIEHISKRTTREKLLSYLLSRSRETGQSSFTIPFDRQALADYLSVDRSAMSTELGKLKSDGIIDFDRNHFTLLRRDQ